MKRHLYSSRRKKSITILLSLLTFILCSAGSSWANDLPMGLEQFKDIPADLQAALSRAEQLVAQEKYTEARKYLELYKEQNPGATHPLLSYGLGHFCYRMGDLDSAITYLNSTVAIAPEFKDAWQLLAICLQETGNELSDEESKEKKQQRLQALQQAARAMEKAAQLAGDDNFHYMSALMWLEGGKPNLALAILQRLSNTPSSKQEWLVALSDTLKALKRHEETAETMEKAARMQNNPDLLFHAAWLWMDLEKTKRALPLLEILAERKKPDKNWLLLLVTAYNGLKQPGKAALTLERVIEIEPASDYLYNCGLLWLQDDNPERALVSLLQLEERTPPQADWFVALAQAHLIKEDIPRAADSMERAAMLSQKPDHIYRAGVLRLQLKQADRAISLLSKLEDLPKVKAEWMVALANSWLLKEHYLNGARYMEKAANISGKGEHYHRAGMLYRLESVMDKSIALLQKSVAVKKVKQLWLVDLASVLVDVEKESEAVSAMARTELLKKEVGTQLRYRGSVVWLNLQQPEKAYPLLKSLSAEKNVQASWLNSFVKTCVELGHMGEAQKSLTRVLNSFPSKVESWKLAVWFSLQQGDYVAAAAAKEVVSKFEPENTKHLEELSKFYLLAGVPEKAAKLYQQSIGAEISQEEIRHLVDIYLSGQMHEEALLHAEKMIKIDETAANWESLGDIYYALRRFADSLNAYTKSIELEDNPATLIKAGYAAMKAEDLNKAAKMFMGVIESAEVESSLVDSANQNLAYINRVIEWREEIN